MALKRTVRPIHAYVLRALCPHAKSKSNSDLIVSQFSNHNIFCLGTRAVKQPRGCVAILILVIVYYLDFSPNWPRLNTLFR